MNTDEYDNLAQQLEIELNDQNTLIHFKVAGSLAYILDFNKGQDTPLDHFIIRAKLNINDRKLVGFIKWPCSLVVNQIPEQIEPILQQTIKHLDHCILHPHEITELKVIYYPIIHP
jgi:hypothetical protein